MFYHGVPAGRLDFLISIYQPIYLGLLTGQVCEIRWPDEGQLSRNKWVCRLTKNCKRLNLLDGIFEVGWQLRKFWWVKKKVLTRKGFLSTDFSANQIKFCLSANGPLYSGPMSIYRKNKEKIFSRTRLNIPPHHARYVWFVSNLVDWFDAS